MDPEDLDSDADDRRIMPPSVSSSQPLLPFSPSNRASVFNSVLADATPQPGSSSIHAPGPTPVASSTPVLGSNSNSGVDVSSSSNLPPYSVVLRSKFTFNPTNKFSRGRIANGTRFPMHLKMDPGDVGIVVHFPDSPEPSTKFTVHMRDTSSTFVPAVIKPGMRYDVSNFVKKVGTPSLIPSAIEFTYTD